MRREKRVRFGDYIKNIRLNDPRELTQSDLAKVLGISVSFLSEIENRHRSPLNPERIDKFVEFFNLTEEQKLYMYDLASHENDEIPHDIAELLKYEKVGEMALMALREFKAGNLEEEDWQQLACKAAKNKKRREEGEDE
jgi:transcriptional regulator with XRE-family HTH domain